MRLSTSFQSRKNLGISSSEKDTADASTSRPVIGIPVAPSESEFQARKSSAGESTRKGSAWSVYLIVSSVLPKTYVGVTTNISRRLKQHNGALKGGAKSSRAGRPWHCACIIKGFKDKSKAFEFEAKWKIISRKMPRKNKKDIDRSCALLTHRREALDKLQGSFDCSGLKIEWSSCSLSQGS